MRRKDFLISLAAMPLISLSMKIDTLSQLTKNLDETEQMPLLFLGHGSPMNAIEENEFVEGFRNISLQISKPKAIVCISAHWQTSGTWVTAMPKPETIHDFGGFPKALFEVQYPAVGNPELALELKSKMKQTSVELDYKWGLDHGTWSVVKHLYPNADVPVIQLSLDYNLSPEAHYKLAKELMEFRNKGILIVGSGNIVHNLRLIAWDKPLTDEFGYDWAIEANQKTKDLILDNNHQALINFNKLGKAFELAIPTAEHFLPLLYILSLKHENEAVRFFNDKNLGGSLSMTSLIVK